MVLTWLAVAVVMGLLLVLADAAEGPLDDADAAYQRPGILDLGELPVPAPKVTDTLPTPGRTAVVFFLRPGQLGSLCDALTEVEFHRQPDVALVVAGPSFLCTAEATVLADPDAGLADAYGLRTPRDDGASVGYAVVDDVSMIRYRTLDPEVADLLAEVDTILRAT